jgi:hypothetical protein
MRIARSFLSLAAAALVFTGCANQQEPAEKALAQVEASLAEVRADAEKYAAEQLANVEEGVKMLKNNMAHKDYRGVLMNAPSVSKSIADLKTKVAADKAEAEANLAAAQTEWTELTASVPPMVEALQKRVDTLTKTKKLPKDMDQAAFDAAKSGVEQVKTAWTDAGTDFADGKAAEALRKARAAKARGEALVEQLGAKVG